MFGPASASSGWPEICARHQANWSGSEVSAFSSNPTASGVGRSLVPGVRRCPSPKAPASWVTREVSSRTAVFICRCHIGAERMAAAKSDRSSSVRSPMQAPMEWASMWRGPGRPATSGWASSASTSRW